MVKIRSMYMVPGKSARNSTVFQWELFAENEFLSAINVFHANIVEPGVTLEPHQHENEEQIFFILSGMGVIEVGDEEQAVGEGDTIYLPPKLMHSIKNIGTYPLRFLAIGAKIK